MYRKEFKVGDKVGKRTIEEKLSCTKNGYLLYKVRCACGEESVLSGSYLRQYPDRQCRTCSLKENNIKGPDHYNFRHGRASRLLGKQRLYHIWICMRQRCLNPKAVQFKDYGGRGIKICTEWDSVDQFCKDMGERPSIRHTLDRIDVNGNYCKENCRWATYEEQARNRRKPCNKHIAENVSKS